MADLERPNYQIARWKQALQKPARLIVDRIFPTQELDSDSRSNLLKACEMLNEEYGIIVTINHFAKPEFFYLFSKLFSTDEFSQRGGLMALGTHEYRWLIVNFAKAVGVDTMPVVVSSTVKVMGTKAKSFGAGLEEYTEASAKRLAMAGTVLAIPQGQRGPRLGESRSTLIYTLLDDAAYYGAKRVAVMAAGIGFLKSANYEDRGFHFFEQGVVRFNKPRTKEEIMEITNGNPKEIERFIFDQLREVVPENYR